MKRHLLFLALAAGGAAHAENVSIHDYCTATPTEKTVADATALLIFTSMIHPNGDGTVRIDADPLEQVDPGINVCPDEPIWHRMHTPAGRTAFVIADGALLTAPHVTTWDPTQYSAVFGVHDVRGEDGKCSQMDFSHVPVSNVYTGLVKLVSGLDNAAAPADYMALGLPRTVPGVTPLPLRRSGAPNVGDPLLFAGYGLHLPVRIALGSSVRAVLPDGIDIGTSAGWTGHSGSPVFNLRAQVVETVIASPALSYGFSPDYEHGCFRPLDLGHAPPPILNNGSLARIVAAVPAASNQLQIAPRSRVDHVTVAGGGYSNATSRFNVSLPATATQPLTFDVTGAGPQYGAAGANLTLKPGVGTYTLAPGATQAFQVQATPRSTQCGVFDAEVRVEPAGGIVQTLPHRFEANMTDFSVAPLDDWSVAEIAAPYATRTLHLTNPRDTPATVALTTTAGWLRTNGSAGGQVTVPSRGALDVALSVDTAAAAALPIGQTSRGTLTLAPATPECSLRAAETLSVSFTRGVRTFEGLGSGDALAAPVAGQSFGAVMDVPVASGDEGAFVVGDVDLKLALLAQPPFAVDAATAAPWLKIELVAPDGTTALLWDRRAAPASYVSGGEATFAGTVFTASFLTLDDAVTPPLEGQLLGVFNGKAGAGTWHVRVSTTDTTGRVTPITAALTFKVRAPRVP